MVEYHLVRCVQGEGGAHLSTAQPWAESEREGSESRPMIGYDAQRKIVLVVASVNRVVHPALCCSVISPRLDQMLSRATRATTNALRSTAQLTHTPRTASPLHIRTMASSTDGLVVTVSADGKVNAPSNDLSSLQSQWTASRADATKPGTTRLLYGSTTPYAAVSLGKQNTYVPKTGPDAVDDGNEGEYLRNQNLEKIRIAVAKGVRALRDIGSPQTGTDSAPPQRKLGVETTASPHAAATGALLATYQTNHFRTRGATGSHAFECAAEKQGGKEIEIVPASDAKAEELLDTEDAVGGDVPLSWQTGTAYAEAQNLSRELAETPAK